MNLRLWTLRSWLPKLPHNLHKSKSHKNNLKLMEVKAAVKKAKERTSKEVLKEKRLRQVDKHRLLMPILAELLTQKIKISVNGTHKS